MRYKCILFYSKKFPAVRGIPILIPNSQIFIYDLCKKKKDSFRGSMINLLSVVLLFIFAPTSPLTTMAASMCGVRS